MERQEQVKPGMKTERMVGGKDFGVVRILSKDIEGKLNVYVGLTKIKGISWTFSHAICNSLSLPKLKKIGDLSQEEIKKISEFISHPNLPAHLLNRRKDFETGETKHLSGTDLDVKKEFDIKRLKKIKSYRGLRHAAGQPTRGQRTRSHFRNINRKKTGGKRVAAVPKVPVTKTP